ncbi:FAD-dependent monooxygenase [Saxibacter everestensis]|uniref:FAD-dependent monooxygenase n=1 Tax=Saxibacter everestensis TaxID=2909229 RepID=A0ABY8QZ38_9MICO|nr:FAD-dependent monooxygenase [Brevibacteriaceae bacterium ZFBP1038]
MSNPDISTDVLIIGAGPTGLMLANCLRRLDVDAVIVDRKSGPTQESRALGIQARTMEIYDQLGLVDTVLAQAQAAIAISPGYEDHAFGAIPIGDIGAGVSPYPSVYVLEQSRNEQIMVDSLLSLGGSVLWNYELLALDEQADTTDPGSVAPGRRSGTPGAASATFSTPDGRRTVEARYCVGADGGSSQVRSLRNIAFEGITNQHTFYVADGTGVNGLVDKAVNVRMGRTDFLISFPMASGGHDRLIGVVRESDIPGEPEPAARQEPEPAAPHEPEPATPHEPEPAVPRRPKAKASDPAGKDIPEQIARDRLRRIFGVTYRDTSWFSTYRVHHRVAEKFRDGPFFLAGDAGHLHSPVGAQGMNTGLQDAHNLACKLSDVIRNHAPDSYLDRYGAERRPVALRIVASTDRLFGLVTSENQLARLVRRFGPRFIGPLLIRILPRLSGSARLFGYISQTRIHYWMNDDAKAAAGGKRGRIVGRRLPWSGANYTCLQDLSWQVHTYGDVDAASVARLRRNLALDIHCFPDARNNGLEPGQFYLVRPDGFVAAAAPGDLAEAAIRKALPYPTSEP